MNNGDHLGSDRLLVVLVRHAEAGTPEAFSRHRPQRPDHERPLTAGGREQAQLLAEVLAAIGPRPTRVFSSTYRRALQTAEPLARSAGLPLESMIDDRTIFDPPLSPERLRAALFDAAATTMRARSDPASSLRLRSGFFVFGHEPDLSRVLETWLCEGRREARGVLPFDKATAAIVDLPREPSRSRGQVNARLHAILPLGLLESLVERIGT
ncbi:MAG: SixA phosphatase family protein [Thioalkalivibrionaceae bacterium]